MRGCKMYIYVELYGLKVDGLV